MKKIKYVKYKDADGVYSYDMQLPSGNVFKEVPQELGNYVHQLEQKLGISAIREKF